MEQHTSYIPPSKRYGATLLIASHLPEEMEQLSEKVQRLSLFEKDNAAFTL